jgi:histone H1/5
MVDITEIKGVGPKAADKLIAAGIKTAEALSKSDIDTVVAAGLGKKTAEKIINNAKEILSTSDTPKEEKKAKKAPKKEKKAPKEETKPKKAPKKKKVVEEPIVEEPVEEPVEEELEEIEEADIQIAEHERSPTPSGIPTKKKRGIQIRSTPKVKAKARKAVEKPAGWIVEAKELSEEELVNKKKRQEELSRQHRITRDIPQHPTPLKSTKAKVEAKQERPVKVEQTKKKAKVQKKKIKKVIDYYTVEDLQTREVAIRKKGVSGKAGTKKQRIQIDRNEEIGKISSHRRSRRVIHHKQVIVDLVEGYNPNALLGQKVYFVYPDTEVKVPGSITKRFGKQSSAKVLVNFQRGVRTDGINQKLFIK